MANPKHAAGHRSPGVGLPLRLLLLLTPFLISFLLATQMGGFDPAPFPEGFDSPEIAIVEKEYRAVLGNASERVGDGLFTGPEDLAYDEKEGFIYTGCDDGWIRRFRPAAAKDVEEWAYVGGRPLGVAVSPDGCIVVAEAYKGKSMLWDVVMKYPILRKILVIPAKLAKLPPVKEGGVISVNLEGRLTALYSDQKLPHVTSGLKVGKDLYFGSLTNGYILRVDLNKFAADV